MTGSKTKRSGDEKKQFSVVASSEVKTLVARITNKYSRAVVAMHPTDDDGPMDAGLGDCPLFTAALQALDDHLDPKKPAQIVEFIDQFKKKRGPHVEREEEVADKPTPIRKHAMSATAAANHSTKRDSGSFKALKEL
jgi:hypothetical protein